jgi:hypothetical protein
MVIPMVNLCNIVIYIYPNNFRSQKLTQNQENKGKIYAESRSEHNKAPAPQGAGAEQAGQFMSLEENQTRPVRDKNRQF